MKVGIITLNFHSNIGGVLQGYALQTVLERMGHEVFHIQQERKAPSVCALTKQLVERLIKELFGKPVSRDVFPSLSYLKQYSAIDSFRRLNLKEIEVKSGKWHKLNKCGFDAYIVGSDQIWRWAYIDNNYSHYFLDFANDDVSVKKLAYAASFGTDEWEYPKDVSIICRKLIQKFDAVSVRESSGIELCKKYWDVDAVHVLDPTMLLSKEDYLDIIENSFAHPSGGQLMSYILDNYEEKQDIIKHIARREGYISFLACNPRAEDWNCVAQDRIQIPVGQWLRGFYDAKLIVTDSFHACVFSIIFNKPFIAIANKERGRSRFESLLDMFGLQERLVSNPMDALNLSIEIDFTLVNEKLRELQNKSFEFLKTVL